jgi:hypothetical protein
MWVRREEGGGEVLYQAQDTRSDKREGGRRKEGLERGRRRCGEIRSRRADGMREEGGGGGTLIFQSKIVFWDPNI